MQVFFNSEESLHDRVKIECLEKLQNCLNQIGRFCPQIEKLIIAQSVQFEEGKAQVSIGQDLSILLNINDKFL